MLCIFDAHVHLFDCKANTHAFLEREDPTLRYIIGDLGPLAGRRLLAKVARPERRQFQSAAHHRLSR